MTSREVRRTQPRHRSAPPPPADSTSDRDHGRAVRVAKRPAPLRRHDFDPQRRARHKPVDRRLSRKGHPHQDPDHARRAHRIDPSTLFASLPLPAGRRLAPSTSSTPRRPPQTQTPRPRSADRSPRRGRRRAACSASGLILGAGIRAAGAARGYRTATEMQPEGKTLVTPTRHACSPAPRASRPVAAAAGAAILGSGCDPGDGHPRVASQVEHASFEGPRAPTLPHRQSASTRRFKRRGMARRRRDGVSVRARGGRPLGAALRQWG